MKKNILLVLNPTAGSLNVELVLSKTKHWSQKLETQLKVYKTTGNNDEGKIKHLLNTSTYSRILVAGGDGTLKMVASVVIDTPIILGILPYGSANGLATSLAIPKDIDQQLEIAFTKDAMYMDTILVNDVLCVHIADMGINAELIYNYEKTASSGMLGYALQVIPTLFKSGAPYDFKISINDKVMKEKGVLLAFANAEKYGTGARINPDGKINDGKFEVILYKKLSIREILKTFFKNWSVQKTSVATYSTTSVSIGCKKPVPLQVDGEYIGEFKDFSAQINPKSLRVAVQ
ncbi:diacylglycerol/lipid kinase family protein [Polaribacter vadi]|uniref:diacylglycerol/lipid kinase family protein n=1 Tax=Polaribacter vadi TaxID=1774273 RepID=UPI0030EF11FF